MRSHFGYSKYFNSGVTLRQKSVGIQHAIEAVDYGLAGFKAAYKHEEAIRQEIVVFSVLIPVAFWLGNTAIEIILLVGCCLIVVAAEIFNAAIETVVDRISLEDNELSGRAKDLASAAVYITWINMIMTWVVIGVDRFFSG
jgi:diacylglycerol kinase (ATP)